MVGHGLECAPYEAAIAALQADGKARDAVLDAILLREGPRPPADAEGVAAVPKIDRAEAGIVRKPFPDQIVPKARLC